MGCSVNVAAQNFCSNKSRETFLDVTVILAPDR